ncbi:DUF2752 domain-containing protein [Ruania suaedae]|uniref:DUF2752 domain-containing protein n=1 Tax=Ruania suaedae TaxID=2897774 RepID=UPI001E466BDF|nr:DUF2752 domain-containing protein [Ruania suaedae]UFU04400.1 DUF2752 domain-containing protein [Ruania suaedae]
MSDLGTDAGHAAGAGAPRLARDRVSPAVIGAVTAAATAVVVMLRPGAGGPVLCPLLAVTGLYCPMCGGLRTTAALAGGDLAAAWSVNPLLTLLLPAAALAWLVWMVRSWRGQRPLRIPGALFPALASAILVFGVLRNVPVLSTYLAP